MSAIKLAITDDEVLFRQGMSSLLEDYPEMQIILDAQHGADLLQKLSEAPETPDIVLLDMNMPVLNGSDTAKMLQEQFPQVGIIILSSFFSEAFVVNLIQLGAAAYLPKNSPIEDVVKTIQMVKQKGFYYSDHVMEIVRRRMMEGTWKKPQQEDKITPISKREKEVLQLIVNQNTTDEIADKLHISPQTVKGHRNNLLSKLGCRNTAGMVAFAVKRSLVQVEFA
ncbi:response regulator transcription factor [Pontibacter sp. G13]|uniref:response regulator transcription factor n=1 Tax=Pontibacter sp. G13 TaxID=3074898 RepID=UPI00288C251E|nr:response regulator transcription factor [Pontibacter sp. G13]WNJ17087.1 response regulator transcription factor [Pontibacter sp. G13]